MPKIVFKPASKTYTFNGVKYLTLKEALALEQKHKIATAQLHDGESITTL
jgi:hypothetical protein